MDIIQEIREELLSEFKNIIEGLGTKVWLKVQYVDDVLIIVSNVPLGTRVIDGNLIVTEEGLNDNMDRKRSVEEVTM